MARASERRLYSRDQAIDLLNINRDAFQHLVNTRQLTEIILGGERRFDSRDIDFLIDTYRAVTQGGLNESSPAV